MGIIEEVLAFSRDYVNGNQTQERRNKIASAYRQVTGETLRVGCSTCYIEAIFKIKKMMDRKPRSYRLAPGAVLSAFGDESKILTNKTTDEDLTSRGTSFDELAEWHLRNNPGYINLFVIYPSPLPWLAEPAKELEIVPVAEKTEGPTEAKTEEPKKRRTRKSKEE